MIQWTAFCVLVVGVMCLQATRVVSTQDLQYLVTASKVVRAGQAYEVNIQTGDVDGPVTFYANISTLGSRYDYDTRTYVPIYREDTDTTYAEGSLILASGDSGTLRLNVPTTMQSYSIYLNVEGNSDSEDGVHFQNSSQLQFSTKSRSPFIQTDKAIYKPGQEVKMRGFVMLPNLNTSREAINLTVTDPPGNKRYLWPNNEGPAGVVSKSFKLSDQPILGDWKITLEHLTDKLEKIITVAEYTLPKFEVKVKLPPYFHHTAGSLKGKVEAKYTYGQAVEGHVNMRVQRKPYSWGGNYNYSSFNLTGNLENGTFEFDIQQEALGALTATYRRGKRDAEKGLAVEEDSDGARVEEDSDGAPERSPDEDPLNTVYGQEILFVATVTEFLTDIKLTGNGTVKVERYKYTFSFTDSTATDFKPGLNYTAYVKIQQLDGTPPTGADLDHTIFLNAYVKEIEQGEQFRGTIISSESLRLEQPLSSTGINAFNFRIPRKYTAAQLSTDSTLTSPPSYYPSMNIEEFKSLSRQAMQLSMLGGISNVKTGDTVTFLLESTEAISSFSYMLQNKGKIVDHVDVSKLEASTENTFDITFDGELARSLAPRARMLAYYVRDDDMSEMIVDTLDFVSKDIFAHQVSLSFSTSQVKPGVELQLEAQADPGAFLAILAVDKSVLLLKSGNDIDKDMVESELEQYDTAYSYRGYGRKKRDVMCMGCYWPYRYIGGKDGSELISNAGFIVLTNSYIHKEEEQEDYRYRYALPGMPEEDMDMAGGGQAGPGAPGPMPEDDDDGDKSSSGESESNLDVMQQPGKTRSEFPENWLWIDAQLGDDGRLVQTVTAPDTITSWVATGFGVSEENGLGVSEAAQLNVFMPFFVSLTLPYCVVRGEKFKMLVTIFNYQDEMQEVTVTLKGSMHFIVHRGPDRDNPRDTPSGEDEVTTVRVLANKGSTLEIWIEPYEKLGQMDIEVMAQTVAEADALVRQVIVKPEGIPKTKAQCTLIMLDGSEVNPVAHQFSIDYPDNLVEGSNRVTLSIVGDLMGSSLQNLDSLVRMPYGCGEQNMINFAPNVYVLQYLLQTDQMTPAIEDKIYTFIRAGYDRELSYQRNDGSFSAFGQSDNSGSMWLSAFVMRVFEQTAELELDAPEPKIVDTNKLAYIAQWILRFQEEGTFSEPGRVIHTGMQGGSSEGIALTAYVLTTLTSHQDMVETAIRNNQDKLEITVEQFERAIISSRNYLEGKLNNLAFPYTLAIVTYALTVSDSFRKTEALLKFESMGKSEGAMTYWECGAPECSSGHSRYHAQASAGQVELNAYALLIYAHLGDISKGLPLMRWLLKQQNGNGGFTSTQDTVLALQALAEFGVLVSNPSAQDLLIEIIDGENTYPSIHITRDNSILYLQQQIENDVDSVEIQASGTGTAMICLMQDFNIEDDEDSTPVRVWANSTLREPWLDVEVCAWIDNAIPGQNGMALIKLYQLSGYVFDKTGVLQQNPLARRIETTDEMVTIYLDELPSEDMAACFKLLGQKVVDVEDIKPKEVTAMLYYMPDLYQSQLYSFNMPDIWRTSGPPQRQNITTTTPASDITSNASDTTTKTSVTTSDYNPSFNTATKMSCSSVMTCLTFLSMWLLLVWHM